MSQSQLYSVTFHIVHITFYLRTELLIISEHFPSCNLDVILLQQDIISRKTEMQPVDRNTKEGKTGGLEWMWVVSAGFYRLQSDDLHSVHFLCQTLSPFYFLTVVSFFFSYLLCRHSFPFTSSHYLPSLTIEVCYIFEVSVTPYILVLCMFMFRNVMLSRNKTTEPYKLILTQKN